MKIEHLAIWVSDSGSTSPYNLIEMNNKSIEHLTIWVRNLEKMKEFYVTYFGGIIEEKYNNNSNPFESSFLMFDSGCCLELKMMLDVIEADRSTADYQISGYFHMSFSAGTREMVDELTND